MTRNLLTGLLLASTMLGSAGLAAAQDTTLTIESWRNDDLPLWNEKIIPAFEEKHGAKVEYVAGNSTDTLAKLQAQKGNQQIDVAIVDDGAWAPYMHRITYTLTSERLCNYTCNPDFNVSQLGTVTRWTPVKNLTFSAEVMWFHLDQKMSGSAVFSAASPKPNKNGKLKKLLVSRRFRFS